MAKIWVVHVPAENPDPNKPPNLNMVPVGPDEFKKKKDAQNWCDKMYGSIGGKINLVSSDQD